MNSHYKKKHGEENLRTKSAKAKGRLNSKETELVSSDSSPESYADDSRPGTTDEEPDTTDGSTSGPSRKRRAEEDEVANFEYVWNGFGYDDGVHFQQLNNNNNNLPPMTEMQSWCAALAMTLERMPSEYQIKMKVAISIMVGTAELESLQRSDNNSADRADPTDPADTADTTCEETPAENPIPSEIE